MFVFGKYMQHFLFKNVFFKLLSFNRSRNQVKAFKKWFLIVK